MNTFEAAAHRYLESAADYAASTSLNPEARAVVLALVGIGYAVLSEQQKPCHGDACESCVSESGVAADFEPGKSDDDTEVQK